MQRAGAARASGDQAATGKCCTCAAEKVRNENFLPAGQAFATWFAFVRLPPNHRKWGGKMLDRPNRNAEFTRQQAANENGTSPGRWKLAAFMAAVAVALLIGGLALCVGVWQPSLERTLHFMLAAVLLALAFGALKVAVDGMSGEV